MDNSITVTCPNCCKPISQCDCNLQKHLDSQKTTDIDKILEERGNNYGKFKDHASLSMDIKHVMESGRSWNDCSSSQKEALHMVAHKIARIINGKPDYLDSWVDIVGYIQLVINELKGKIV